jgi:hypothetical protein
MTLPVRREPPPVREDPTRVAAADLGRIDQISALLSTLNDPRAGADALARHLSAIPVLQARIAARFAADYPNRKNHGIAQQIALLGNRVLEGILFELLEDIVTLHSEVEPRTRYER